MLFIFLVLFLGFFLPILQSKSCETIAHSSLSTKEKEELCKLTDERGIGPAICSLLAKEKLHLKSQDILSLCISATNASPAECMLGLSVTHRREIGLKLCSKANSTINAECFNDLKQILNRNENINDILTFCSSIHDFSSLNCIKSLKDFSSQIKKHTLIDKCKDIFGSGKPYIGHPADKLVSNCFINLKPISAQGISIDDLLNFCVSINPMSLPYAIDYISYQNFMNASDHCLLNSFKFLPQIPIKNKLQLCTNSPLSDGPLNCAQYISEHLLKRDPTLKLNNNDLSLLCKGSISDAPAKCFLETSGIGKISERIQICQFALNNGPAHCYRKGIKVLKSDFENLSKLCSFSNSDGPALCVLETPTYLSNEEKVILCADSPVDSFKYPVQCLALVNRIYSTFMNSQKNLLGSSLYSLKNEESKSLRSHILNFCSFGISQNPLASAECLKNAPKSLTLGYSLNLCSNISSVNAIEHIKLCEKLLSNKFDAQSITQLCDKVQSQEKLEIVTRCALESIKLNTNRNFSNLNISYLCSQENSQGIIIKCLKSILDNHLSYPQNEHLIIQLCENPHFDKSLCINEFNKLEKRFLISDNNFPVFICSKNTFQQIFPCLNSLTKKYLEVNDIINCETNPSKPSLIRLKSILNQDNGIDFIAGKRTVITFTVLNQYNQLFLDLNRTTIFYININENNFQGAILWGVRHNYSVNGLLKFDNLVFSQSGDLDLKIYEKTESKKRVIASFKVYIKEDENKKKANECFYIFSGKCFGEIYHEDSNLIRTYELSSNYLQNILCHNESLQVIGVNSFLLPDGSLFAEYRSGIESIWTGIGLPKSEMTDQERLGLILPKEASKPEILKKIKKAYYFNSLKWHPDRWVGMKEYLYIIQGVFHLITESYDNLMTEFA